MKLQNFFLSGTEQFIDPADGNTILADVSPPGLHLNEKGDGMIAWTDTSVASKRSVFTKNIVNYAPSGGITTEAAPATASLTGLTAPVLNLNYNKKGLLLWLDHETGSHNVQGLHK